MPRKQRPIVHHLTRHYPRDRQRVVAETLVVRVEGRLRGHELSDPWNAVARLLTAEFNLRTRARVAQIRRIDLDVDDRRRFVAHIQGEAYDIEREARQVEEARLLGNEQEREEFRLDAEAAGLPTTGPYSPDDLRAITAAGRRRLSTEAVLGSEKRSPFAGASSPGTAGYAPAATVREFQKARARMHGNGPAATQSRDVPPTGPAGVSRPKSATATVSIGDIGFDDETKQLIRTLNESVVRAEKLVGGEPLRVDPAYVPAWMADPRSVTLPLRAKAASAPIEQIEAEFRAGPRGPIAPGTAPTPVPRKRFDQNAYDVLVALDEEDGLDWITKHRLYEGHIALLTVGSFRHEGRRVRHIYATPRAQNDPRMRDIGRVLVRSRVKNSKSFLEQPVYDPSGSRQAYETGRASAEGAQEGVDGAAHAVAEARKLAGAPSEVVDQESIADRQAASKDRQLRELLGKPDLDPIDSLHALREEVDVYSAGRQFFRAKLASGAVIDQAKDEAISAWMHRAWLAATSPADSNVRRGA
jgi:hypothetical protein